MEISGESSGSMVRPSGHTLSSSFYVSFLCVAKKRRAHLGPLWDFKTLGAFFEPTGRDKERDGESEVYSRNRVQSEDSPAKRMIIISRFSPGSL